MSDDRLRAVRRTYDQGKATRLEWVAALARVQPYLVELAAYCYDDDALAALGFPARSSSAQRFEPHLWATTLPHVVRLAEREWPAREVEVRAALVFAHVTVNAWCTLGCERSICMQLGRERLGIEGSGHLLSMHYEEVGRTLNWAERAIAGRTSWRRLAAEDMGWGAQAWLDQDGPLKIATGAISVVRSRLPGTAHISLVTVAGRLARDLVHRNRPPQSADAWSEVRAALEHIEKDLPERLASDLGPWLLGERDPVQERLRSRGQRPAVVHG